MVRFYVTCQAPDWFIDMKIKTVELQLKQSQTIELPGKVKKIYGVETAGPIFCALIGNNNVEYAAALLLDNTNEIINYFTISIGRINSVSVSLPQLFRAALLSNAVKMIVAHNHPSGVLSITQKDIAMTKRIGKTAKDFDIELIDSLIVSGTNVVSIREHCGEFI